VLASSAAPSHAAHVRVDALAAASLARPRSDPAIHDHMVGARVNHRHESATVTAPTPPQAASADGAIVARGVLQYL
jgi:hypothetical protein